MSLTVRSSSFVEFTQQLYRDSASFSNDLTSPSFSSPTHTHTHTHSTSTHSTSIHTPYTHTHHTHHTPHTIQQGGKAASRVLTVFHVVTSHVRVLFIPKSRDAMSAMAGRLCCSYCHAHVCHELSHGGCVAVRRAKVFVSTTQWRHVAITHSKECDDPSHAGA